MSDVIEKKPITDDDIARMIGNRALAHIREMYPQVYDTAMYQSCRTSLRNHIRNDVRSLIRAIRGDAALQDYVVRLTFQQEDEPAAGDTE